MERDILKLNIKIKLYKLKQLGLFNWPHYDSNFIIEYLRKNDIDINLRTGLINEKNINKLKVFKIDILDKIEV